MSPMRGRSSEALVQAKEYRTSAVLVLLYLDDNVLHSVLTERQTYEGNHSGQMSFPGGKMEESDQSPVDTALRECREEIGVGQNSIQIIGQLTNVFIPVSNFLVHPFVGFVNEKPETILDEREVKSIIHFPISELMDENSRVQTKIKLGGGLNLKDIEAFMIQDKIVWGATALICNELKQIFRRF
ncbi:CoA pyrophosphatase [Crocinitomix catalasitica]|nr:CoA pyrophosphatase [Crocinitomix catalasitica]